MPAVGSSRNTTSGRPIDRAGASDSRCCSPPDEAAATSNRPDRPSRPAPAAPTGRARRRRRTPRAERPRAAGCRGGRRRTGASRRSGGRSAEAEATGSSPSTRTEPDRRRGGTPRGSPPSSPCRRRVRSQQHRDRAGRRRERHPVDGPDAPVADPRSRTSIAVTASRRTYRTPSGRPPIRPLRCTGARHPTDPHRGRCRSGRSGPPGRSVPAGSRSTRDHRRRRLATARRWPSTELDPGPHQGAVGVEEQGVGPTTPPSRRPAPLRGPGQAAGGRRRRARRRGARPPPPLPNTPSADAPDGGGEADNVVLRTHGYDAGGLQPSTSGCPTGTSAPSSGSSTASGR